MALKVYDPKNVAVVFNGVPISGYAAGSFVSVEYNVDAFSLVVGTDGESTRAKSNNRSARVTITLLQTSASNDAISAFHNLDLLSPSGAGIGPLLISDKNGRTLFLAEKAWVVKFPTSEYSDTDASRAWMFETDSLNATIGGN